MKSKDYIILALIVLLNLSGANASDFENHDFDSAFQMDVPNGSSFKKISSLFGLDIGNTRVYQDFENDINISYARVDDDGKYLNDMVRTIENEPGVNLTKEDGLYLIETGKFNIVLFDKNHNIVAISAGNLDFDILKATANSLS